MDERGNASIHLTLVDTTSNSNIIQAGYFKEVSLRGAFEKTAMSDELVQVQKPMKRVYDFFYMSVPRTSTGAPS